ncbi:hypothetical protein [Candidatus Enterovibrio altilux]
MRLNQSNKKAIWYSTSTEIHDRMIGTFIGCEYYI